MGNGCFSKISYLITPYDIYHRCPHGSWIEVHGIRDLRMIDLDRVNVNIRMCCIFTSKSGNLGSFGCVDLKTVCARW